jgi:hypothetical protein
MTVEKSNDYIKNSGKLKAEIEETLEKAKNVDD